MGQLEKGRRPEILLRQKFLHRMPSFMIASGSPLLSLTFFSIIALRTIMAMYVVPIHVPPLFYFLHCADELQLNHISKLTTHLSNPISLDGP